MCAASARACLPAWSWGGVAAWLAACSSGPTATPVNAGRAERAPLSVAADERMVVVPAGLFISGSTPEERAAAYDAYQTTSGNDEIRQKQWFEREADRHGVTLPAYRIDLMPVTNAQYAELVLEQHLPAPSIDEPAWRAQGIGLDFAAQVARFEWPGNRPPDRREDHPVVLVSWSDAERYCAWRGTLRGEARRLPSADELEKGARGESGLAYPWGNAFEASKLNSAVGGPGDTTPVGNYGAGASPYGLLDMAGNVREWSSSPASQVLARDVAATAAPDAMAVKGSAWIDFGGFGRGATVDVQAKATRHVAVGFRCAGPASDEN